MTTSSRAAGLRQELERSGYFAEGFAERYDSFRPRPPVVLLDWLPWLARVTRPNLVVDLGSGTGLSTKPWAERAEAVVGVEPNDAMRMYAASSIDAENVRFSDGSAYDTGLPDGSADIVTCSQSLQWMEPTATFAEVARILRPGGVFAAYQYESLQTPFWEPEQAWEELRVTKSRLRAERGLDAGKSRWAVSREALERTGRFRWVRELSLHSVEEGDARRLVGLALTEGSLTTLLAAGVGEEEVGLARLREVAERTLGDRPWPWLIGYRAWLGLRRDD
jgi:ubiquinone/menaquinone biosynthesis C-methylase UbiE